MVPITFGHPVSVKLNQENFLMLFSHIAPLIRIFYLLGYVNCHVAMPGPVHHQAR
jgi:hypothetical protein